MADHWDAMLKTALLSGIRPHDFWQLSVREWLMIAPKNQSGMRREKLEELMKRFES